MRKILLVILTYTSLSVTGQVKILNSSLKNGDSSVLYIDVDNLLQFDGQTKTKSYNVFANGKKLIKSDSTFRFTPTSTNEVKVEIWEERQIVSSRLFRVDIIRPPILGIGGQSNKSLTRQFLSANSYLTFIRPNCQLKLTTRIYGFRCRTIRNRFGTKEFNVDGPRFPIDLVEEIKKMETGDKLQFENIKIGQGVLGSSACPRAQESFEITII